MNGPVLSMMSKALLFDLDDTLVIEEASAEAAFLATCERARERYGLDPQALTQSVRERARQLWFASPTHPYCRTIGISSWEGLWARFLGDDPHLKALREFAPTYRRDSWTRALADQGVDDAGFGEELAETFREERRGRHILFPDSEGILRDLRGNYTLGLITNGVPDIQRSKIQGAGLEPHFKEIIISGEVGVGKPDPRIFEVALKRMAVPAEETAMVGNSLARDVIGAQRVGIRGIWLNRSGAEREEDCSPYAEIGSLTELRHVIERF